MEREYPEGSNEGRGEKKPYKTPELTIFDRLEHLTANAKQPGSSDSLSSTAHSGGGFP